MASLADLIPLVEELKRAGYSDAEIPGIIQRLHAGGFHQSVPVVTGQVETDREQAALESAANVQQSRAQTGIGLLDDARLRSQQLIDLQRDPDNIVSYFAAIAGLPEQGATPVQSLLGQGFRLEPTLPSPYTDPNYIKLRDSLYDFGRPRTVEENIAETARGRQASLNQFAADQYRKDPNAFLKWTQATRGMAGGGNMKIDEPMVAIGTASGQPRFTIGEFGDETVKGAAGGLKITPLTQAQGEVPGNVQQAMFRMVGLPAQQMEDTVKSHAQGGQLSPLRRVSLGMSRIPAGHESERWSPLRRASYALSLAGDDNPFAPPTPVTPPQMPPPGGLSPLRRLSLGLSRIAPGEDAGMSPLRRASLGLSKVPGFAGGGEMDVPSYATGGSLADALRALAGAGITNPNDPRLFRPAGLDPNIAYDPRRANGGAGLLAGMSPDTSSTTPGQAAAVQQGRQWIANMYSQYGATPILGFNANGSPATSRDVYAGTQRYTSPGGMPVLTQPVNGAPVPEGQQARPGGYYGPRDAAGQPTATNTLLPSTSPAAASTPSVPSADPNEFLNQQQSFAQGDQAFAPSTAAGAPPTIFRRPAAATEPRFTNFAEGGSLSPADAAFDAAYKIYAKNPFVDNSFLSALQQRMPPPPGSITQRFLANTPPSGWQALQAAIRARIGGTALDDYLSEVPRFFAQGGPPSSVRYI